MKLNKDEVCILIPTLNEVLTIGEIIQDFRDLGYSHILKSMEIVADDRVKSLS